ncbi:MAG: RNA polymerase factor sigma-54 [Gammaproteobacteria bacterium]|nr:RNA polymerase factor sigma-54 [Gammaproteobacteria bacterium]MBK9428788.1 RNA polymerase factor sigma-54 [Gammaproteobacteria bacterium]
MKQGLHLKFGQQLSMTPQLQQAIKLLQLSSLELQQEIQQVLCSNPLLELLEDLESADTESLDSSESDNDDADHNTGDAWNETIPDELPVDARWDDIYQTSSTPASGQSQGDAPDFESFHTVTESIRDHLHWQLNLTQMSDVDRVIATAVIDAVDDNGFLALSIDDIWHGLASADDLPHAGDGASGVDREEVVAVLHHVQQFDPPGVAAVDLRDCLMIQLGQFSAATPHRDIALTLVDRHLALVAEGDYPGLARRLGVPEHDIRAAVRLIQTLSPHPGDRFQAPDTGYVNPDVSVRKEGKRWVVTLNTEFTPKLGINQYYASQVQRADNSPDNRYLRDNLQEARWFLRSLESRNETLLRVAHCIVEMQQAFLEEGPERMKPMVLADVASQLQLHESTISRVTTHKYIATPRGIYELKYFFSSHVSTASGGECSSTAIRAMLKKMIAAEPATRPLSDSQLALLLQEQGIQVARRTVAKYRESLNIASSGDRKRFKRSA